MKHIQKLRGMTQLLFILCMIVGIRINTSLFNVLIVSTILVGGVYYCGWLCPFGFAQDLSRKIGKLLGFKKRRIPLAIHQVMIYFRYIFSIILILGVVGLVLELMRFEPRGAFFLTITGRMPARLAAVMMVTFMIASMFYDRVYCRYLCPEGGKYGLYSFLRILTIKRNSQTCLQCKKCDKVCPMQIQVSNIETLKSPQCINCFKCISSCPVKGCMKYSRRF